MTTTQTTETLVAKFSAFREAESKLAELEWAAVYGRTVKHCQAARIKLPAAQLAFTEAKADWDAAL